MFNADTAMWKRLQGVGRDKEKPISNPVLLETTYDEDRLQQIPTVNQVQNADYQPNIHLPTASPNIK